MSQVSRLKWQCRRGMRELDVLLEAYLEGPYRQATAERQAAFRALLEFSNRELLSCLLGEPGAVNPALESVVAEIRAYR